MTSSVHPLKEKDERFFFSFLDSLHGLDQIKKHNGSLECFKAILMKKICYFYSITNDGDMLAQFVQKLSTYEFR